MRSGYERQDNTDKRDSRDSMNIEELVREKQEECLQRVFDAQEARIKELELETDQMRFILSEMSQLVDAELKRIRQR